MSKLFSKSTGCFYPADMQSAYVEAGTWPDDAVAVSDAVFDSAMARPANKIITADANGQPVLSDPVGPTLAQAQVAQVALLSAACNAAITANVISGAYTYPTKTTDQTNLAAAVNLSALPGNAATWSVPIMCQSANGVWARVPHSMTQVQKVGQDVFMQILGLLMRNDSLAAQVAAAGSVAAAQLITW